MIEDAAQAHGARVHGAPVGRGATATFSLYATKNITSGEGGLITTDDDDIAARLRLLRNHGMRARYDYAMPGSNYRLTDLQAAIACVQLNRLPTIQADRSRNATLLSAGLAGLRGLILPVAPAGAACLASVHDPADSRGAAGPRPARQMPGCRRHRRGRLLPEAGPRLPLLPGPSAGRMRRHTSCCARCTASPVAACASVAHWRRHQQDCLLSPGKPGAMTNC